MDAINFPGCNVVYGKDQEGYIQLPANFNTKTGMAITQWKLSDDEVAEIVKNKRIFIGISTFGKPLQPILPTVMAMYHPGEEPELQTEPEFSAEAVVGTEGNETDIKLCADCPDREACINGGGCKKG